MNILIHPEVMSFGVYESESKAKYPKGHEDEYFFELPSVGEGLFSCTPQNTHRDIGAHTIEKNVSEPEA
jgi:hypothetical protein